VLCNGGAACIRERGKCAVSGRNRDTIKNSRSCAGDPEIIDPLRRKREGRGEGGREGGRGNVKRHLHARDALSRIVKAADIFNADTRRVCN